MAAIVIPVTDNSFDPEVLKCDIPVLAHFWAEWSAQGRKVNPLLSAIAADYSAQVKVVSVEIEANPVTTANYQVLNVPTLILLKFGQEMTRLTGPQSTASIIAAISPWFDR